MRVRTHSGRLQATIVLVLIACTAVAGEPSARVAADFEPCANVDFDPGPPVGKGKPLVAGRVDDATTTAGIEGAVMRLYRCVEGDDPILIDGTTTDELGDYTFPELDGGHYYYVEAVMTGPLEGLSPAPGSSNPTPAMGLGESVDDADMSFN